MDSRAGIRIDRKRALGMDQVIEDLIRDLKLSSGLNQRRIFAAWTEASQCGRWTVRQYFRDGILHVKLSSSTVRSSLLFQCDAIKDRINAILMDDPLFTKKGPGVSFVQKIILK